MEVQFQFYTVHLTTFQSHVFQCHLAHRCETIGQILPKESHDGLCGHLGLGGWWKLIQSMTPSLSLIMSQLNRSKLRNSCFSATKTAKLLYFFIISSLQIFKGSYKVNFRCCVCPSGIHVYMLVFLWVWGGQHSGANSADRPWRGEKVLRIWLHQKHAAPG